MPRVIQAAQRDNFALGRIWTWRKIESLSTSLQTKTISGQSTLGEGGCAPLGCAPLEPGMAAGLHLDEVCLGCLAGEPLLLDEPVSAVCHEKLRQRTADDVAGLQGERSARLNRQ